MLELNENARESRARRLAQRQGYVLCKSRLRGDTHADDFGGWRIVDGHGNWIVAGAKFDLDLDDVERWLAELQ